jgi:branched-chain amino acid transport system permease protein
MFRFQVSIFLVIIVIFSGAGSVIGVLIGGLIIATFDTIFLAQVLPSLDFLKGVDIQQLRWVFFGFGLVIIMLFRPQGLFPVRSYRRKGNGSSKLKLGDAEIATTEGGD